MVRQINYTTHQQGWVERLDSLSIRIYEVVEEVHKTWSNERCEDCSTTELTTKDEQCCKDQWHIEHIAKRTHLNRWEEIMEHQCQAIDTTRHHIIRVNKYNEGDSHQQTTKDNLTD